MWDGRLGTVTTVKHYIDLQPDSVRHLSIRTRCGLRTKEQEVQKTDRMLKEGVIETAMSARASSVVSVPRRYGELRFCDEYRKHNAMTVRDTYPSARMEGLMYSLKNATIFSLFDCNSRPWQTEIPKVDPDKTIFSATTIYFNLSECRSG